VDIIDFTEFQRYGCMVSPAAAASGCPPPLPHSHSITGTLFCQPDTNTVRLNLTVLGPCSPPSNMAAAANCGSNSLMTATTMRQQQQQQLWDDTLAALSIQQELGQKDVKPWIMTSNKMAGGGTATMDVVVGKDNGHQRLVVDDQYSPFTSPVSPPCSQDGPPPLLDFHSDQLMSEIQSMTFDTYGCSSGGGGLSLNSQLFGSSSSDASGATAVVPASSLLLHSPLSNINSHSQCNSSGGGFNASAVSALLLASHNAGHHLTGSNNAATTTTTTTKGGGGGELKVSSSGNGNLVHNGSIAAVSINPPTAAMVMDHLLLQSQSSQMCNNPLVKASALYSSHSGDNNAKSFSLSLSPSSTSSPTASNNCQPPPTAVAPMLLLQPKIERSDSICSEYSNSGGNLGRDDDFLSYSNMTADLDDLEAETAAASSYAAVSPPMAVVSTASSYHPLLFPPFIGGSGSRSNNDPIALSPIGKPTGGGGGNSPFFNNKSFSSSSYSHQGSNNKMSDTIGGSSSSSTDGSPATKGMAWSPLSSSSLVLPDTMTSSPTATTTAVKSPIIIPLPSATQAGGFAGMLNNSGSGHSSPKTPSSTASAHCAAASPRSVGSTHDGSGGGQLSQLMLGSPLHHHTSLNGGGVSPKARNRRNSSFDESKPHVCPQCGARFTTKSNLGQHAKIHLAVKPFICEICSHGFTRAAHYESHVAKHKGLKTHR
jgi:Zinc finger, C2H2 type